MLKHFRNGHIQFYTKHYKSLLLLLLNQYALTVICMFTNYVFYMPLPDRLINTLVNAYCKDVYCHICGSHKLLSHNEGEFKNKLFSEVTSEMEIQHIFSSPYRQQTKRRKESSYKFMKKCIH